MKGNHPTSVWEGTRDIADIADRQPLFVEVALFSSIVLVSVFRLLYFVVRHDFAAWLIGYGGEP